MGLKCSVIGHRFEEPGLVHEREPRGDEVITISREVVVCTRCGKQRVLTERKEITTPTDETTTTDSDDTPETDDTGSLTDETDAAGIAGVDVIGDDTESSEPIESTEPIDTTTAADSETTPARADNGIVLTDEEDDREYGAWPEPSTPSPAADTGSETAAETDSTIDDQQNLTDEQRDTTDPVLTDADAADLKPTVDAAIDDGEIITANSGHASECTEKTLSCQSCSFTVTASESPFRPGDSCPECREAYLMNGE